jgi:hypothetical protein
VRHRHREKTEPPHFSSLAGYNDFRLRQLIAPGQEPVGSGGGIHGEAWTENAEPGDVVGMLVGDDDGVNVGEADADGL